MSERRCVPILLVDDDENDILLFRRAVSNTGCAVGLVSLTSGQQALDYLGGAGEYGDRQRHPLPQIIFLDAHLPQIRGEQVLRYVKSDAALQVIPVIILTGAISPKEATQLYRLGANAICLKPVSAPQMDTFALNICRFWVESILPAAPDQG